MKNLEKAIILALHPECKMWEEAMKKNRIFSHNEHCFSQGTDAWQPVHKDIPISLPRVMQALRKINHKSMGSIYVDEFGKIGYHTIGRNKKICDWKLTDNGKDLNLEDQTEKTREAISKLFNV